MTMDGVLSINVRDHALSRENIMAFVLPLGGRWILIQDSSELCQMCLAAGMKVIARFTGDDPEHNPLGQMPEEFVRARANATPKGAYLHLTNEIDPSPGLNEWTIRAMRECERLGYKAVVLNHSTHKSRAQWEACQPVITDAVANGHAIGAHVYLNDTNAVGAHEWMGMRDRFGGLWILTEFAFALDAYHGYRGTLSDEQCIDFARKWAAFYWAAGIPVLWFSYEHWTRNAEGEQHGFGIIDKPAIQTGFVLINRDYKLGAELPPIQPPTSPPVFPYEPGEYILERTPIGVINARDDTAILADNIVGHLLTGQRITVHGMTDEADGQWVNFHAEIDGYFNLQNGKVKLKRMD